MSSGGGKTPVYHQAAFATQSFPPLPGPGLSHPAPTTGARRLAGLAGNKGAVTNARTAALPQTIRKADVPKLRAALASAAKTPGNKGQVAPSRSGGVRSEPVDITDEPDVQPLQSPKAKSEAAKRALAATDAKARSEAAKRSGQAEADDAETLLEVPGLMSSGSSRTPAKQPRLTLTVAEKAVTPASSGQTDKATKAVDRSALGSAAKRTRNSKEEAATDEPETIDSADEGELPQPASKRGKAEAQDQSGKTPVVARKGRRQQVDSNEGPVRKRAKGLGAGDPMELDGAEETQTEDNDGVFSFPDDEPAKKTGSNREVAELAAGSAVLPTIRVLLGGVRITSTTGENSGRSEKAENLPPSTYLYCDIPNRMLSVGPDARPSGAKPRAAPILQIPLSHVSCILVNKTRAPFSIAFWLREDVGFSDALKGGESKVGGRGARNAGKPEDETKAGRTTKRAQFTTGAQAQSQASATKGKGAGKASTPDSFCRVLCMVTSDFQTEDERKEDLTRFFSAFLREMKEALKDETESSSGAGDLPNVNECVALVDATWPQDVEDPPYPPPAKLSRRTGAKSGEESAGSGPRTRGSDGGMGRSPHSFTPVTLDDLMKDGPELAPSGGKDFVRRSVRSSGSGLSGLSGPSGSSGSKVSPKPSSDVTDLDIEDTFGVARATSGGTSAVTRRSTRLASSAEDKAKMLFTSHSITITQVFSAGLKAPTKRLSVP